MWLVKIFEAEKKKVFRGDKVSKCNERWDEVCDGVALLLDNNTNGT